ncbi:carboxypeptidase regulatory-like domain-containing protein [Nocardioides oleivorans]|uniref:carboxypeptidase regulatory-like domain-containing protein n=1 Tax=Nocardioides oleivorans TaxID=273676 RepID=UPI0013EC2FF5|nr:carboxypeptidase regulatory-like domain-containing protein [Nocardioides oleivorans]
MKPSLRARAVVLLLLGLLGPLLVVAPAQAAPAPGAGAGTTTGRITGTVTGTDGALSGDVTVQAYARTGSTWTDVSGWVSLNPGSTGHYSVALPAGEYKIRFSSYSTYNTEYFDDSPDLAGARVLTVVAGGTVAGVDAELTLASRVAGTVTDPAGGPVASAYVAAQTRSTEPGHPWREVKGVYTRTDGTYDLGVPAGTYRLRFMPGEGAPLAPQFYGDAATADTSQDVVVGVDDAIYGFDAQLAAEGTVSGTVTDEAGAPLENAEVQLDLLVGSTWVSGGGAKTDEHGAYTAHRLRRGTYRALILGSDFGEYWPNQGREEDAGRIEVVAGAAVTGIDAQLIDQEHDEKALLVRTDPTISGAPAVGSVLTADPGVWTPTDVTLSYQWVRGRDDIPGATSSTYTLTAADVGSYVTVDVVASHPGYRDYFFHSFWIEAIGPVVAPPTPVVTPGVPAPAPVPATAPVITFSKKIGITGARKVGSTLRLKNSSALVTRSAVTYRIQWYAGSRKITKATGSRLKVTNALRGKSISVRVAATSGATTTSITVKAGLIRG